MYIYIYTHTHIYTCMCVNVCMYMIIMMNVSLKTIQCTALTFYILQRILYLGGRQKIRKFENWKITSSIKWITSTKASFRGRKLCSIIHN